jgi:ribose transport system substrate-binding protein
LLTANPKLRAVLCGNDSMALGAVAAVKAAGKTGQVLVAGYDNISAVQPMIADGRLVATADQFAARQAVFGIETALRAVAGKTPQGKLAAVIETPVEAVSRK